MSLTRFYLAVAGLAAFLLIGGSWSPFAYRPGEWPTVLDAFWQSRLTRSFSRTDIVVNFWVGFPVSLALCGALIFHSGGIMRRFASGLLVLAIQSVLSLTAEIGQGWFESRVPSILDVIMQMLGCATAMVLWTVCGGWLHRQLRGSFSERNQTAERLDIGLGLTALGILVWSVMPLDVTVTAADFARKLPRTELFPFTKLLPTLSENLYQWFASTALAVPLGLWLIRYLSRRPGPALSALSIGWLAIGLGVLPEICQVFIISRVGSATDALFGALGAVLGCVLAGGIGVTRMQSASSGVRQLPKRSEFWFSVTCLIGIIVCAVAWMPFDFTTEPHELRDRLIQLRHVPIKAWGGSDLSTGLTLFRHFMLAGMLGAATSMIAKCVAPGAKTRRLMVAALGLASAPVFFGFVELGQVLANSRSGDLGDWIIRLTGFYAAFWFCTSVKWTAAKQPALANR